MAEADPAATYNNPMMAMIPTVGYMGHVPVYRKPICAIGADSGQQYFDLSTTKEGHDQATVVSEAKKCGLSEGFRKVVEKQDVCFDVRFRLRRTRR